LFSVGNAVLLFNARPGVSNHEIYGLILLQKIRVIHRSSVCARAARYAVHLASMRMIRGERVQNEVLLFTLGAMSFVRVQLYGVNSHD